MRHNILLIENDAVEANSVRQALAASSDGGFQLVWVRKVSEALERLEKDGMPRAQRATLAIDAILLDLFLPDSRGVATLKRLSGVAPEIPILILAAPQHERTAKLAVLGGARAYILKTQLHTYSLVEAVRSMIARGEQAEVLRGAGERAQLTLDSIGDAVLSIDDRGLVAYLNVVAEHLTGWSCAEAAGHPVNEVFRIIDADTRVPVPNPMELAMRENKAVSLTPNCVLIRRDGGELGIEDSAAPIHDRKGLVTGAVIVFHDVSGSRAMAAKMSYLAQHDELTGLPNRALLDDRLCRAIALAHRQHKRLGVLFLDLDRFKHINDSLGHDIGDCVLQSVAKQILGCVRNSDTVSRVGGDEFVVLLAELERVDDAAISAEKILAALSRPHRIAQHDLHLTVSIGIATYPDDATSADKLKKNADMAMYQAKVHGRNGYHFFKSEANVRVINRQSMEKRLRHALERNEFVLHYQPKMNLVSGAITGVEALIRWQQPGYGLMRPFSFIPAAQECGMMGRIGLWVLREACRQTRAWQCDADLVPTRVAVNISATEFRHRDFVEAVRTVLADTGLEPRYLELELTESALMRDTESSIGLLRTLRGLGVHCTLDDFGTGNSSLADLKRFSLDTLKIDRSFVRDLTTNARHVRTLSAVISLGKSLRTRIAAQGVETEVQLEFLRERRCMEGQGYYLRRPTPAGELTKLLGAGPVHTRRLFNEIGSNESS